MSSIKAMMGVTVSKLDADGFHHYRGFRIQRHFLKRAGNKTYYEYRVEGFPTTFSSLQLACDDVDYMIHRRGLMQESC